MNTHTHTLASVVQQSLKKIVPLEASLLIGIKKWNLSILLIGIKVWDLWKLLIGIKFWDLWTLYIGIKLGGKGFTAQLIHRIK